jgi:hypothetical protein
MVLVTVMKVIPCNMQITRNNSFKKMTVTLYRIAIIDVFVCVTM